MNKFSDKMIRRIVRTLSIFAVLFLLLAFYIPAKATFVEDVVENESLIEKGMKKTKASIKLINNSDIGVKDVDLYTFN